MIAKQKKIVLCVLLTLVSQVFAAAAIACVSVETTASVVPGIDVATMSHHKHVSDDNEPARECCERLVCVMVHCFSSATVIFDSPYLAINETSGLGQSEYSVTYLNAELSSLLRPPLSR